MKFITYFISAYEQKVFSHYFTGLKTRLYYKFTDTAKDAGPAFATGFTVYYGGKYLNKKEHEKHWG